MKDRSKERPTSAKVDIFKTKGVTEVLSKGRHEGVGQAMIKFKKKKEKVSEGTRLQGS